MYKIINSDGVKKILNFTQKAKEFQLIEGWIIDAEGQFNSDGQCVLELKAWQTETGAVESMVLNSSDFQSSITDEA